MVHVFFFLIKGTKKSLPIVIELDLSDFGLICLVKESKLSFGIKESIFGFTQRNSLSNVCNIPRYQGHMSHIKGQVA